MRKNGLIVFLLLIILVLLNSLYSTNSKENNTQNTPKQIIDTGGVNVGNKINLSGRNLNKLPDYVLQSTDLEELDISNNQISGALPAEIRKLQSLKALRAGNNQMTGVPAEVGQLSRLEILNLSNNKLTGLPHELGNLKNLKKLILSGNDYAKQDLEVIKKGLSPDVEIIL